MMSYKIDGFQMYEYSSENPDAVIFFAHANGIPALTYANLWTDLSHKLNVTIISYDMRGIGKTIAPPVYHENWGWQILVEDHVKLFERIKKTYPKQTQFILCGHSVGSWISLLSTKSIGIYPLVLCDPPLLRGFEALGWFFMHLFNKRSSNPKSKKVLNRRVSFDSTETAYKSFKKSPFLSKWNKDSLLDYIKGSFQEDSKTKEIFLRHTPEWEAHIFAQYPPTAIHGFIQLPKKLRHALKPIFLVGGASDTCNPKEKKLIKHFFSNAEWIVLPNAGHMFPIENQNLVVNIFSHLKMFEK